MEVKDYVTTIKTIRVVHNNYCSIRSVGSVLSKMRVLVRFVRFGFISIPISSLYCVVHT